MCPPLQHGGCIKIMLLNWIEKLNFASLKSNWWNKSLAVEVYANAIRKTISICVSSDNNKFNYAPQRFYALNSHFEFNP